MKTGLYADSPVRRIAVCSALLGCALLLSYIESLIPVVTVFPGMKIGLANIAVMAASCISLKDAAAVSILRVIIISVLFTNTVSFIFSLFGALASLAVLLFFHLTKFKRISWIGVSVLCALFHNIGQMAGAVIVTASFAVTAYFPVLAAASLFCGAFNGIVMNCLGARIQYKKLRDK